MSGGPPPGNFNPGAFEFRPGQQPFVPRGQQQQQGQPGQQQGQGFDPYAMYGGQPGGGQGYYPQQQQQQQQPYGGYGQYGGGGYQQQQAPQQQAFVPGQGRQTFVPSQQQQPQQRAFVPGQQRQVQGFVPPSFSNNNDGGSRAAPGLSIGGGGAPRAAPSLSIGGGGAPKAAPSLSIGGGAPKAAPSLSIGGGGAPKAAPSLSIGGGAPKAAPSLSIGGKKEASPAPAPATAAPAEKKPEAKKETPAKQDNADDIDEEFGSAPAAAATPAVKEQPVSEPEKKVAVSAAAVPPATDAQTKVVASGDASADGSSSKSAAPAASGASKGTNFTKVSAKNDAEAIYKEQAAAGADAMRDLYGGGDETGGAADPNVKAHLNIIFCGHVDAGKSTMGGQLLYLTGAVDKRTMEKYEQEAKAAGRETWYLSWALDSGKEERAKGKTVEVGRAYFETDSKRYTILDAPGHKTYVPSMIQGAAQADVAMLVLSARKGEFETGFERDGQTREHALLLKNNGINKLVLVVNKMDDPTVEWSEERYIEIQQKITPFLKAVGFNPKTDLTFIPVSAQMGQNMKVKIDKKTAPWYDGPSLLGYLDELQVLDRDINAPFMFPVSEKYNELGTMVMGKIESGRVKKGDTILMMPNRTTVEVAGIFTESAEEIDVAFCGDNIRLRLRGVSDEDVSPGFVLTSPSAPVKVATAFKADISILETKNIIAAGYNCVLHVHTVAEECTISALLHYFERKTRRKSKRPPAFGKQGMLISVLIELPQPICIEKFDDYKMLGRFTLRDEGKTVAIGKVTKLITKSEDMPDVAKLNVAA